MIRALIFDFDGLILDTETPGFRTWQDAFREHGLEANIADWEAYIGAGGGPALFDPEVVLSGHLGAGEVLESTLARRKKLKMDIIERQGAMPGLVAYLDYGRTMGLKMGVASSSSMNWVGGHLTRLGLLDRFQAVKTGDQVERKKPWPDLYLAALESLGAEPYEAIAFEDSPNGIRAARAAGIFTVTVPNWVTAHFDVKHADMRMESLAQMPLDALIAEVVGRRNHAAAPP